MTFWERSRLYSVDLSFLAIIVNFYTDQVWWFLCLFTLLIFFFFLGGGGGGGRGVCMVLGKMLVSMIIFHFCINRISTLVLGFQFESLQLPDNPASPWYWIWQR